ncbi:MAG: methyltransferase domain-containing protein [Rhodovibrionaceae bacterium]
MRVPTPSGDWPESWHLSYQYDCNELLPPPNRFLGYRYAYDERKQSVLDFIEKTIPRPAHVLDVAAAQGNTTISLAEMGYNVVWNDIREELEGYVCLKQERGEIEFRPGNILDMTPQSEFDAVIAMEVIEHVAHPDQFMAHLAGFLKPEGYLLLTTPNGAYFRYDMPKFSECDDPSKYEGIQFGPNGADHIFLLHADEITELASRANLKVVHLEYTANPLTHGHIKLWKFLPLLSEKRVKDLDRWSRRQFGKAKFHDNMTVILQRRL